MKPRAVPALALLLALALAGSPGLAAGQPPPSRTAILVLVPGLAFEAALAEPALEPLLARGGVGLMATRTFGQGPFAAHVTLGGGRVAGAPRGAPQVRPAGDGLVVEVGPYREAAEGATPGALGEAVRLAGGTVAYATPTDAPGPGVLVAMDAGGRVPLASVGAAPSGAAALLDRADLVVVEAADGAEAGRWARELAGTSSSDQTLVVVASPAPSPGMLPRGEEVTALVVARPGSAAAAPAGLTSPSTRRPGLVANVDVAPTILRFLGVPVPGEMTGSPITTDGPPPAELHRRFLEYRALRVPLLAGLGAIAVAFLAVALALVFRGGPRWLRDAVGMGILVVVALPPALLAASYLPSFTWAAVVPAVGLVALAGAWAARGGSLGDPRRALAFLAWLALALIALDAVLGWPGMEISLMGASSLEGGRFYGLPNTYAGVLLGAAVLAAARLSPGRGTALLAGAAALAGAPWLGANLGAGVTLGAAAGLWRWSRATGRVGAPALAGGALGGILALGVLLAAHRFLAPAPTHVGRFLDAGGAGALAEAGARRLALLVRNTSATPVAWLVVAALPVLGTLALRRVGPFGPSLRDDPVWRLGCVILALAAGVGFLVNDTSSLAALASLYLTAALVHPAVDPWTSETRGQRQRPAPQVGALSRGSRGPPGARPRSAG